MLKPLVLALLSPFCLSVRRGANRSSRLLAINVLEEEAVTVPINAPQQLLWGEQLCYTVYISAMGRVSLPARSLLTWQTIVLLFTMSTHLLS
jgi:hypothetical protein